MSPVLARARERLAQLRARAGRAEDQDREVRPAPEPRPVTAREVMATGVVAAPPEATVRTVCELMRKHQIGAVPVVDALDHVIGLVTDRDIVVRAVAARRDIDRVSAGDIMSVGIECADLEAPVDAIKEKMARLRVRRIPVVDHGERLVGIVSRDDL